jgi:hypothetical protein
MNSIPEFALHEILKKIVIFGQSEAKVEATE